MSVDSIEDDVGEYQESNTLVHNDLIVGIEPSDQWSN